MIHLRAHSCYSFLEALPTPGQLAQAGRDTGMHALALTDHLSLAGAVEFYLDCQQTGVRPILGLEIDLELPARSVGRQPGASWPCWPPTCRAGAACAAWSALLLGDPKRTRAGFARSACSTSILPACCA